MLIYSSFNTLNIFSDLLLNAGYCVGTQILCCYNICIWGSTPLFSCTFASFHLKCSFWCLSAMEWHSVTIRGIRKHEEFNALQVSLNQCNEWIDISSPVFSGRIIVKCRVLSQMIPWEWVETLLLTTVISSLVLKPGFSLLPTPFFPTLSNVLHHYPPKPAFF